MNGFLSRFRVLPLLVLVAMLSFGVRLGEAVTGVRDMAASAIAAEAEAQKSATASENKKDATGSGDTKAETKPDAKDALPKADGAKAETTAKAGGDKGKDTVAGSLPEVWSDPAQQSMADSPEQQSLLDDLAQRRQQLDAREKAMDTREAMLKASQKQLEDKLAEMTQLKSQIEQLLGQQDVQENNRIQSLVKIYSGMKPKEAAAIFNQMDMPVLLKVVSKMSERKAAPIIAAMETAKANELTVQLTELRKLPDPAPAADPNAPAPTDAPTGSASLPGLDALGAPKP